MSPQVSSVQRTPSSSTSPVQPSSVHSSPVQPSPVQSSPVQPSSVHSSPVQPSSFHSSSVHSSPVQSNRQHSSSNEGGRVLTSPPRTTVELPSTRSPESRRHLSGSPDQRHSNNSQSNQHNSSTDSNEVFYNNENIRVTNETRTTETQSTSPVITSPELTELPPYRPEPSPTELTVLPDILQHTRPPTTQTRPPVSRRAPIPRQRTFSSSPEKICCDSASCTNAWRLLLKLRWVLVSVATLACCCLLAGIVLGALHVVGHNSVALAIMFAVLGGLLIVVVLIGWRCAPEGHEPCHMLFGIEEEESSRRRRRRRSRHTGTRHRPRGPMWHGGVIPAEFRNRERPPTYNISQQQRQGQTSSDRHETGARQQAAGDWSAPSSNPPSYRSRASTVRTGINITYFAGQSHDEYPNSQPPTYRSGVNTGRARLHRQQSWTPEEAESSTVTTSADQVHEMGWSRAGINQSNTLPSRATHDVTINMPA